MTEQSRAGRGRIQRSHLQVASKETALRTPPGFPASEFTLTTTPLSGDCCQDTAASSPDTEECLTSEKGKNYDLFIILHLWTCRQKQEARAGFDHLPFSAARAAASSFFTWNNLLGTNYCNTWKATLPSPSLTDLGSISCHHDNDD